MDYGRLYGFGNQLSLTCSYYITQNGFVKNEN